MLAAVLSNQEIKAAYPNIAFTQNPWGRGVMGCSSGGVAALKVFEQTLADTLVWMWRGYHAE